MSTVVSEGSKVERSKLFANVFTAMPMAADKMATLNADAQKRVPPHAARR